MCPSGRYDAVVLVSFGGPEGPADVLPFLENVTRGRDVPRQRLLQVAKQYEMFGGVSPINAQNRTLAAALRAELEAHGMPLPVYFGNRNWRPLLADTVADMQHAGVRHALAFVTSAFSSYSGCRQYIEDIERARLAAGSSAPVIDKIRPFWNHPGYIEAVVAQVAATLRDAAWHGDGAGTEMVFTAHSLPLATAERCDYESQLREAAALVAARLPESPAYRIAFQSRSGPPQQPWLEPDIVDHIGERAAAGVRRLVVVPIGFVSDHMEVLYDLDTLARSSAASHGVELRRAPTAGSHPRFVAMARELIAERIGGRGDRAYLGSQGARPDRCPDDCCPAPRRPARPADAA